MALISLRNICKTFSNGEGVEAVSDLTLDIERGEFIVLVGPSGCGKSTTLRMIAGLEKITSGTLEIDGRIANEIEPQKRNIGMVFQNYALFPHMSVYQNIAFGLKLRKLDRKTSRQIIMDTARMLDLENLLDRKPRALSGGQQQRVAMGRAIVRNPEILLMDEPLSNLDAKLRLQMRLEIARIHRELKSTIIYVTHDQVEAMTLATRVVVMNQGKVQQIDTPLNIYDKPANLFVAGFIGMPRMNFFDGTVVKEKDEIKIRPESGVAFDCLMGKRLEELGYLGKKICCGIRPENIREFQSCNQNPFDFMVECPVVGLETLGSDTYIHFSFGESEMIAREMWHREIEVDKPATFVLDTSRLHFFDKGDGNAIN